MYRTTLIFVALTFLVSSQGRAQSFHYADDCFTNVDNATVLLPTTADLSLPGGASLAAADTVAVRDSNGNCVGYGAWTDNGEDLAIAAAGPTSIDEAPSGYEQGTPLSFEVFDVSEAQVRSIGSEVEYASCGSTSIPTCRDDGVYSDGAVFVLSSLKSNTLPVEFARFTATRTDRRARLEWTTAQEENNAGFRVQHRPKGETSEAWETLQFVEGAGTTSRPTDYSVQTRPLDLGTHEFRLRQVDRDGTTALSVPVSVDISLQSAYEVSSVSPNPVRTSGTLSIVVQETQHVTISLYNVLGQQVAVLYDQTLDSNQKETLRVRTQNRSSGLYLLRVKGSDFATTRRMTIVR